MNDNLRLVSIFHYVMGGLGLLVCSLPLIHFFIGFAMLFVPSQIHVDPKQPGAPDMTIPALPIQIAGGAFMAMVAVLVVVGWTFAICTIQSGRYISQRRNRTFSIVIAAINCLHFPWGTALGVVTLILLTKDEARVLYGEIPAPTPPPVPQVLPPQ